MTGAEPDPPLGLCPGLLRQVKQGSQALSSEARQVGELSQFSSKVWAKPTALSKKRFFSLGDLGYLVTHCSSRVDSPTLPGTSPALPMVLQTVSGMRGAALERKPGVSSVLFSPVSVCPLGPDIPDGGAFTLCRSCLIRFR